MKASTSCTTDNNKNETQRMMGGVLLLMLVGLALTLGIQKIQAEEEPQASSPPTAVPYTEESQREIDERHAAENPMSHCDRLPLFQKQCCQRTEQLKSLQQQEFALKNDQDQSLYDLQKDHDQKLAELTLLEGVERLQKDYLDFMKSLYNQPKPLDHPLHQLGKLEDDLKEGMDTVYRMKYLHDAMDLLKSDVGIDLSTAYDSDSVGDLYERFENHCRGKSEGICELVNPQSNYNRNALRRDRFRSDDFKEMLAAYLEIYSVATERANESEQEHQNRIHALNSKLVTSLQKIPQSVLTQQISEYERSRQNIENKFNISNNSPESANVKRLYECIELLRYQRRVNECTNLSGSVLNTAINLNQEIVASQQSVLNSITNLPDSLKSHLQRIGVDRTINNYVGNTQVNPTFDKQHMQNLSNDIERRLGLASHLYHSKPDSVEAFFGDFQELSTNDKELFMSALCAGKESTPAFGTSGFHECLVGLDEEKYRQVAARKNDLTADVAALKQSIKKITDTSAYKNLNTFKNFLAHKIHNQCQKNEGNNQGTTLQGCTTDIAQEVTLAKLVDFTGKVVAEIEHNTVNKAFTTERIIEMFQFCNAQATPQQKIDFEIECNYVNENYRLVTTRYDRVDPDYKAWASENMNRYDPATDTVQVVKRRSTGAMIGLGAARAVSTSIPTFMQYQHTRQMLPFMRDRAMAQKQFAHWNNEFFKVNFAQSRLNQFGMGGFGGYNVGAYNFGAFGAGFGAVGGVRSPITPQGYSIP